ncbi:MAG: response regulator [Actinomycetota bacterium]
MTHGVTTKRVLIIDDQPDIRLMCRVNLALEGFEVVEAGDGETGLAAARQGGIDLILLDVMMPGIDGWQVLAELKSDPGTNAIPVVLLTARVTREDEIRGWKAGAADYLPKPFNPSALTKVASRTLLVSDEDERRRRALQKLSII